MKRISKGLSVLTLGLIANVVIGAPSHLVTHNLTTVESNAYINNKVASNHPTKPGQNGRVSWMLVKMACLGQTDSNGKCPAMIKMKTDTNNPVDLGWVYLDLNSGEITPKTLSNNGYTLTVNGFAEATLTEN